MNWCIFDLDGTIALTDHRQHYLDGDVKQWDEFFAACVHDEPNSPIIDMMNLMHGAGFQVEIWSGRSDAVRYETEEWLDKHEVIYKVLRMRRASDFTPDEELKSAWLDNLLAGNVGARRYHVGNPPRYVFDDRDKVVKMWRDRGLTTLQVAYGAF